MSARRKRSARLHAHDSQHSTPFFRWISFGIIASVFFIVYFHRVSLSVLAPDIAQTFGLSSTVLGILASSYFYSYALMQPVVGVLVDRWKPRRVMTASALLMAIGSIIFCLAPNYGVALLGRTVIGLGAGGIFVPFMWFSSRWFALKERGFVYSLWVVAGNAGAVAAAGPLGFAVSIIGWRMTILALTALTALLGIALWLIVRDDPGELTGKGPTAAVPLVKEVSKVSWFKVIGASLSIRSVQCAVVSLFLSYGALMAFQGLWGVRFLMDLYGLDRTAASNLIMVLPIGLVIGGLALSKVFDTRLGRLVYIGGYLIAAGVYSVLSFTPGGLSLFAVSACVFLLGFTQAVFPYPLRIYSQVLPQKQFGAAMGFVNAMPFLGGVLFQPLTGYIFDLFGTTQGPLPLAAYRWFFVLLAGASLVATITAFWTRADS